MITRRRFLAAGAASLGVASLPLSDSLRAEEGDFVDLVAAPATAPLDAETAPTPVWAYEGTVPGPVLRVRRGGTLRVRLRNRLAQPTSVHWHGIRIDNAMDGVAGLTQEPVPPGGSFDYIFTAPDAGTFWYHPHFRSWEQLARGLHGLLIVDEDAPPAVDRDLAFVADDWRLADDGRIDEASFGNLRDWSHQGRLGNWLTINGVSGPVFPARAGERLRLRCVNVANARILAFDFGHEGLRAWVVALDGQPVPPAELADGRLELAPAQRADLIFDVLAAPGGRIPIHEVSTGEPIEAARIEIGDAPPIRTHTRDAPAPLPANPLPGAVPLADAMEIPLVMEGGAMGGLREARYQGKMVDIRTLAAEGKVWAFNGVVGKPLEPLARIPPGRTVVIAMVNDTAWPHAMHLHGHHFRVIERNGKPVSDAPWRDTELVNRGERVRIAFTADNPGKWLFHCHMLEHQAAGMLTWIEVG